jgi:hypothetical protein
MKADARPDHLPKALAPLIALPHWVIWRWETTKGGKRTKVPYQAARPNGKATSTDPRTWSDFATAAAAAKNADGIGFCLLNSEYGAFDIAHCDAASGAIDPWAEALDAVVAELDAGVKHEDPTHHESPVRRLGTRRHIPRHAPRSAGSLPVERRSSGTV